MDDVTETSCPLPPSLDVLTGRKLCLCEKILQQMGKLEDDLAISADHLGWPERGHALVERLLADPEWGESVGHWMRGNRYLELVKQLAECEFTDDEVKLLDALNDEVVKLTSYGVRKFIVKEPGFILSWSNGGEYWAVWARQREAGEELTLDANQFFSSAPENSLRKVAECLDPLPLFALSMEYTDRHIETPQGAILQKRLWAKKMAQAFTEGRI